MGALASAVVPPICYNCKYVLAKQGLDADLATVPTEGLVKSIAATAKSMGLGLTR